MCTEAHELLALQGSKAGAVLTKSCTLKHREGNPLPRYYGTHGFSINSMGLPNKGIEFYTNFAKQIDKKPYILSICGLSPEENIELLTIALQHPAISAIEINVSCPNIIGKPQLGYDIEGFEEFLHLVKLRYNHLKSDKPIGLKLPPYFDFVHFEAIAKIINDCNAPVNNSASAAQSECNACAAQSECNASTTSVNTSESSECNVIQFIVCSNSLGNGLWIDSDSETVRIKPKNGFGGVGGSVMKATTLANVHKFYQLLKNSVDIIGCGGITSGQDIFDLILVGAKAVQIGTQLMEVGESVFETYLNELTEIMEKKGYTSIDSFRGKVKYIE
jgi:dihydroorotate dehydrogenase (fumarate)